MDKGILITRDRNSIYEKFTALDKSSMGRFLTKMYFNNDAIPIGTTREQLEQIVERVLCIRTRNTYIELEVSNLALREIFEKEDEKSERGTTTLIVELDNIPLVYKRDDYAMIYDITSNVIKLDMDDIDEEDIEEMKRLAFATKVDAVANERFKDYR